MIVSGHYPEGARLLIVGQAPGRTEAERGEPFVGVDGRQLRSWLRQVGLDVQVTAFDNVHQDFNGDPTYKPTTKECKAGYQRLRERILSQPEVSIVLLLGGVAAHMMFKGSMTQMLGQRAEIAGVIFVACWHPGYYYRNALRNGTARQAAQAENDILSVLHQVAAILKGDVKGGATLPDGRYIDSGIVIC